MPRTVKSRYLLPAFIALATIIYAGIVSSINTRDNIRDSERVQHSWRVLTSLQDTLRYMIDLETGQRGFLIVGDESYLEPYHEALKRVDTELDHLTQLTEDNPDQQFKLGRIREAITQTKGSLEKSIEARRLGSFDRSTTEAAEGAGKEQMDQLRHLVAGMRNREQQLLEKRQDKLTRSIRRTNLTVVVSGFVAIVIGGIGTFLLLLFLLTKDRADSLKLQKEKAEDADRAKSNFLAVMSHEIRTPMTAILGFGELLHGRLKDPQEKHFASAILSSGRSLLSLINDILDLSKIEAGKLEIIPDRVDITNFAQSIETLFSFEAAAKGLRFSVRVTPSVPHILEFDAPRLRQVIVNLIGNAIKFTPKGSVIAYLRATPATADGNVNLLIDVSDTGIGIAHDKLDEIFRPFFQIDSRSERQFEGTGLGLDICRRLVEMMEGELTVSSSLGEGSIFSVTIPTSIHPAWAPASAPETWVPADFRLLRPSKILLVRCTQHHTYLIKNLLANSSHQLLETDHGEEIFAKFNEVNVDAILMDLGAMGGTAGAILARLKADGDTRPIPVIALSPPSPHEATDELMMIFDGLVPTPIEKAVLYQELARFLPRHDEDGDLIPYLPEHEASWSELCDILDEIRESTWPDIMRLVPAQGTLKFSSYLLQLAHEHHCSELQTYSERLSSAAGVLDFSEASRILKEFPSVISQLRSFS